MKALKPMPPTGEPHSNALRWSVIIPVKAPGVAKSRLSPALPSSARAQLARAFALDTIAAALAARSVARVIVVGDDPSLAGGAEFLPEPADGERGLLRAIRYGVAHALGVEQSAPLQAEGSALLRGEEIAQRPSGNPTAQSLAVLLGDLPALKPEELDAALEAASRHPLAFVRDADGTGTTLATATGGSSLEPKFGADSAARHVTAGFVELEAFDAPGLHRDVDTVEALADALVLGIGARTLEVVARLDDLRERIGP